jgi:hypothetical protein
VEVAEAGSLQYGERDSKRKPNGGSGGLSLNRPGRRARVVEWG